MDELSFIPTRASSSHHGQGKADFQTTVFEAYKAKEKVSPTATGNSENPVPKREELDMKKVRFEVFKFGVSGFNSKKKERCNVSLAVELGAKPSKNKCKNYKELQVLKKRQIEMQAERKRMVALGKIKGVSSDKGKKWMYGAKKKTNSGILESYGKVGDNGYKKNKKHKH